MAMDMFMKLDGIPGEARDHAHKGEIDVLAWSWGMSQSGSAHVGGGMGAGKVNVQDLSFTKYIDKSSTVLMQQCCNGKHIATATLTVRKAGGDEPVEYLIITMNDCLISSLSTGGSGGEDRLTENVTLNFGKFQVAYQAQAETGAKSGGQVFAKWNIAENKTF